MTSMAESTAQSIEIDAPPAACFAVAVDIESYPEWAAGVKRVEILEKDAEGRPHRAAFVLEGFVKKISYELVYDYDPPHRMSWSADPAPDIGVVVGPSAMTDAESGGTEVVYALSVVPTFKMPGFSRRQAEKQIVTTALRGLRQRVQERTG